MPPRLGTYKRCEDASAFERAYTGRRVQSEYSEDSKAGART